jgi:diacylglycerol kinase family enzyme
MDDGAPLILVNPRAARLGDAARRERVVAEVSRAVQRRYGRLPRIEAGTLEAARAALAEATAAPLVVVVGGDGSIREAAEALVGRETPLAIIPGGTGNVLAGALGVRGVRSGVDAIQSGQTRRLDLGLARWWPTADGTTRPDASDQRIFMVACGMGIDARIWRPQARMEATVPLRRVRRGGDPRARPARIDPVPDRGGR